MNPFLWFQRLFVPPSDEESPDAVPGLEDESPFVFNQHMRIVLAIVITIGGAIVLWWIMV